MSNLGFERNLAMRGIPLTRTAVGDRYVVEAMRRIGSNLGGEQSGHIILGDYCTTGDGLMAALQVLAAIVETGAPASEVCNVFTPIPQLLRNVRFGGGAPLEARSVQTAIAAGERRLGARGRHPGAQVRHRAADPHHGRGRGRGARRCRRRGDRRRHRRRRNGRRARRRMKGRVLVVAGSDSGGGAGIQADIKTITALGAYAATAITALTAQNTEAVLGIVPVAPDFVRLQIEAVLGDIGADCVKTGMLLDAAMIDVVAAALPARAAARRRSGDGGLERHAAPRRERDRHADAAASSRARAWSRRTRPRRRSLAGIAVRSLDDMRRAADKLLAMGAQAVVLKGGHVAGDIVRDLVAERGASFVLEAPRIATRSTHGTGCTLASAIAAGLAQGMALRAAVERAHGYVQRAIATAPGLGRGNGPLNHAHRFD